MDSTVKTYNHYLDKTCVIQSISKNFQRDKKSEFMLADARGISETPLDQVES